MMRPPSTNHSVAEANPENTTCGGATASAMASMKKRRPTMCSGSAATAHSPTVNTVSAAACMVCTDTPSGGGVRYTAIAAVTTTKDRTVDAFIMERRDD